MSKSTRKPATRAEFFRANATKRVDDSRTSCPTTAKFSYRMRRDAEKARDLLRAKTGETTLDVYRCGECGWLHVGKSRFRRAQ